MKESMSHVSCANIKGHLLQVEGTRVMKWCDWHARDILESNLFPVWFREKRQAIPSNSLPCFSWFISISISRAFFLFSILLLFSVHFLFSWSHSRLASHFVEFSLLLMSLPSAETPLPCLHDYTSSDREWNCVLQARTTSGLLTALLVKSLVAVFSFLLQDILVFFSAWMNAE